MELQAGKQGKMAPLKFEPKDPKVPFGIRLPKPLADKVIKYALESGSDRTTVLIELIEAGLAVHEGRKLGK